MIMISAWSLRDTHKIMIHKMCNNLLTIAWIALKFTMHARLVSRYYHAKNHACRMKGIKDIAHHVFGFEGY